MRHSLLSSILLLASMPTGPTTEADEAWEEHEARRAAREAGAKRQAEEAARVALGILAVACPRCHAPIGQHCDPRTLGRYHYHQARVRAAKETT